MSWVALSHHPSQRIYRLIHLEHSLKLRAELSPYWAESPRFFILCRIARPYRRRIWRWTDRSCCRARRIFDSFFGISHQRLGHLNRASDIKEFPHELGISIGHRGHGDRLELIARHHSLQKPWHERVSCSRRLYQPLWFHPYLVSRTKQFSFVMH